MPAFEPMFFDGFHGLVRVLLVVPVLYAAVVVCVRLAGVRSTSQMNSFDWIVTVAMGSMIASPILLEDVVVAEAVLGVAMLLLMQRVVTSLTVRSSTVERWVKAQPSLLFYRGRFMEHTMRRRRIAKAEVIAAIREAGHACLDQIEAVVLETDASLSVLSSKACEDVDAIEVLDGLTPRA